MTTEKVRFAPRCCGNADVVAVYFAPPSPVANFYNFEPSRFDCCAKIIMVAALWPVMKVAEVTSESQTRECSVNIGEEMF